MRLSMQCDLGGARARSEERALCLIPFSHTCKPQVTEALLSMASILQQAATSGGAKRARR